MNETQQLQKQVDDLKKELNDLKILFYKDNFSNLKVFVKDVQFNSLLRFPNADTTAAGSYKGRIAIVVNGTTQYLHYFDA